MPFAEISGHEKPLALLRGALENGRLSHAYLFLGPEGAGKRTVALAFARAMQCRAAAGDFCGQCADCAQVAGGNHPDVRMVEPAGKKDIAIQQVRELERELSFRPFSGRRKIAIVDPASALNVAAQNALLKTLEEPTGSSILVLIAAGTGGLLPTLVSRCVRLNFAPLPLKVVAELVVNRKGWDRRRADVLAALAAGNPGKALGPECELLVERRRVWLERIFSMVQGDCRAALAAAEEIAADKEDCRRFLDWAQGWYRDLLVYGVRGDLAQALNRDLLDALKGQAALCDTGRILRVRAEVVRIAARIRRNVNRRLALENFFMDSVGKP